MHLAVMGAGSVGLLLASKLAEVYEEIEVITRTETQAECLRRDGITLEGESTDVQHKIKVISFEKQLNFTEENMALDYLVLTVKQSAIDEPLIAYIKSRLAPHTTVVCFQNGIGHEEKLLQHLHKDQLLLAVTTEGARKLNATRVKHTGRGITYLGYTEFMEEEMSLKAQKIFGEVLENAGFEVSLSKNMDTRVWNKLVINSVINPITAVLRIPNGELLQSAHCLAMMQALFREAISVAAVKKIPISGDLWKTILLVCENTSANHSSMLQDIEECRITEIENINGSLLRLAKQLELELPVNQIFYHMVKALENK